MKQLFAISLCFLTLAACNRKSDTTGDVSPKEVCVWKNGDWTDDSTNSFWSKSPTDIQP